MNNRRRVLAALAAAATTASARVFAQAKNPPMAPFVIGWLAATSKQSSGYALSAFRQGMSAHGWREGSDFVIEERWAEGRMDRIPALAKELSSKRPAVFVASATAIVGIIAKAAPRVPIVQGSGGNLVAAGFAESLARPGGMVTGLTNINDDIAGKHIELLLETVPQTREVGLLLDPGLGHGTALLAAQRALARYAIEPLVVHVTRPEEIEPAFASFAKNGVQAVIVGAAAWLTAERARILDFASGRRWPVVAPQAVYAEAGALLSYGTDRAALFRRAAFYVDRILKGTKPGDLPIEQPTTFELVVNLRTAKALGITIPQTVMVRADRVIQ